MMDTYQAQDLFIESVGIAAYQNREELIDLLRKNGVNVDDNISSRDLISITMVACAKSTTCRGDLTNFLADSVIEDQVGYVSEDFFSLTAEERKKRNEDRKKTREQLRQERIKKQGGTSAGNLLRSQAAQDTLVSGLNAAISGLFSGKNKDQMDQTLVAATDIADSAGKESVAPKKSKWVFPAIIGGVVVIGAILFFTLRKKNKA